MIEIRNLTACAILVIINCLQPDANEPSAFVGAHRCFTAHEGGPSLVSRFFQTTLVRIESAAVLRDLLVLMRTYRATTNGSQLNLVAVFLVLDWCCAVHGRDKTALRARRVMGRASSGIYINWGEP